MTPLGIKWIWPVKRFCKLFSLSVFTTGARTLAATHNLIHTYIKLARTWGFQNRSSCQTMEGLFLFSALVWPFSLAGLVSVPLILLLLFNCPLQRRRLHPPPQASDSPNEAERCTPEPNVTIIKAIHYTKTSVSVQSWSSQGASPLFYSQSLVLVFCFTFFFLRTKEQLFPNILNLTNLEPHLHFWNSSTLLSKAMFHSKYKIRKICFVS